MTRAETGSIFLSILITDVRFSCKQSKSEVSQMHSGPEVNFCLWVVFVLCPPPRLFFWPTSESSRTIEREASTEG